MRSFVLLLIGVCLLATRTTSATEITLDALAWKVTQNVDWTLNTNSNPVNQFVGYETIHYDYDAGFRIGVLRETEVCDVRFAYTRYGTSTSDSATGQLTAAFFGGKQAQPPAPKYYFDTGEIAADLAYDIFDLDFGRTYQPTEALTLRPILGLRGGRIDQSFDSTFRSAYSDAGGPLERTIVESMTNNFWGIGPKLGVETSVNLFRGADSELNLTANVSTAYLVGHWTIDDTTRIVDVQNGATTVTNKSIIVPDRDFGAVTFQTLVGVEWRHHGWSAALGYELNNWLNQCQIFDDATGAHNNDLILQGLTIRVALAF